MSEQDNEIIDYENMFKVSNSEDFSDKTEKRSIYALIVYFVIFFIGIGVLFGHFVSQLFIYPYDQNNTNEFIIEKLSVDENIVGLVDSNYFDYSNYPNITLVNTIVIDNNNYDIVINKNNYLELTFIFNTFNNELSIYELISNDTIIYINNDPNNKQITLLIAIGSTLHEYYTNTIDFKTIENTHVIGRYKTAYTTLVNFFVYILVTIPVLFLFRREVIYDFTLLKKDKLRSLETTINGFGLMLVIGIGANVITLIIKTLLALSNDAVNQESIIASMQSNSMIFMLLTSVILAPIVEELIFRKAIFSLAINPKISIAISSLLFSIMHILNEPNLLSALVNVIPYLSMGIFLGYFYEYKTNRNIGILILMHLLNNLFGALQILFLR